MFQEAMVYLGSINVFDSFVQLIYDFNVLQDINSFSIQSSLMILC